MKVYLEPQFLALSTRSLKFLALPTTISLSRSEVGKIMKKGALVRKMEPFPLRPHTESAPTTLPL